MNYRPIALLCSVSKVLESLAKKQLLSFCLPNQVIQDCQFGFLPGRSTTWQFLSILEDWSSATDQRHTVHAAFLDIAKAFDHVDHTIS